MTIDWEQADIISVDIFDTLLFRAAAEPSEIFLHVWDAFRTGENAHNSLSPEEFRRIRIEAERRARKRKPGGEVYLSEIYEAAPDCIGRDKKRLEDLEVECEAGYCYCNPEIYELVRKAKQAGKQVVLLSDMYLKREQIEYLLAQSGIDAKLFDEIMISCEYGCSKQKGGLFGKLKERFAAVEQDRILHIGDNRGSDCRQAEAAGIRAVCYDVVPAKLNDIYDYEKIRHRSPQKGLLSLRKLAAARAAGNCRDVRLRPACEIGASVAGPFLALFITHVTERLKELDLHRIYPFMREGYLLGELLKREAKFRQYDLEVHPVYISRSVTFLPSIERIDREGIEDLIGTRNLTVREAVRLAGLDTEPFSDLEQWFDLPVKQAHQIRYKDQTVKETLIRRLLEPAQKEAMEQAVQEAREGLTGYFLQEIGDPEGAATIDIGFFGRIQMWMEKALTLQGISHRMKHFLAVGLTGDKVSDGIDFEGCYGTFADNMDLITTIHRTTDILEKLISVSEGSTIGYERQDGKWLPQQGPALPQQEFTEAVFDGIFEFQRLWQYFCKQKPDIAGACLADRRGTLKIMHRLIDMPRLEEAELFRNVSADTNFGTEYVNGIITPRDLALSEQKGVDYIDKCNASYTWEDNRIVWPRGVVTLADEYYYVRRALKNAAGSEVLRLMQEVVENAQNQGIREAALYGAGENGRQFCFICRLYHMKVSCFVDRKESLWGTCKEGVPVMGLKQAREMGCRNYIITSLFSISEIESSIREAFADTEEKVRIFKV